MLIRGHQLWRKPASARKMFQDRAQQFRNRLGWDVSVDHEGYEIDEYDSGKALYIVLEGPNNPHIASMRLLPTTEPTMLNDHFVDILPTGRIESSKIWESTRFCVTDAAPPGTSLRLISHASLCLRHYGVEKLVAVFDRRMKRVYRLLEIEPVSLGAKTCDGYQVFAGIWDLKGEKFDCLCQTAAEENVADQISKEEMLTVV